MTEQTKKEVYFAGLTTDEKKAKFTMDAKLAADLSKRYFATKHTKNKSFNAEFNNQSVKGVAILSLPQLEDRIKDLEKKGGFEAQVVVYKQGLAELDASHKLLANATSSYGTVGGKYSYGKISEITRDKKAFTTAY